MRATLPSLEALDCLRHYRQNHHYVAIAADTDGGDGGGDDYLLHPFHCGHHDAAVGQFSSDDLEIQAIQ